MLLGTTSPRPHSVLLVTGGHSRTKGCYAACQQSSPSTFQQNRVTQPHSICTCMHALHAWLFAWCISRVAAGAGTGPVPHTRHQAAQVHTVIAPHCAGGCHPLMPSRPSGWREGHYRHTQGVSCCMSACSGLLPDTKHVSAHMVSKCALMALCVCCCACMQSAYGLPKYRRHKSHQTTRTPTKW